MRGPSGRLGAIAAAMGLALLAAAPAHAQQPGRDEVAALDSIAAVYAAIGRTHGSSIWPGFRADTIPLQFFIPERGALLIGWRESLPSGYVPAGVGRAWRADNAPTAASTGVTIGGRVVAQVALEREWYGRGTSARASAAATAVHEAFHTFAASSRREGRRFGQQENAFFVGSYPVFDLRNEAMFALEGELLHRALVTTEVDSTRDFASQFVGTRRARHALLVPDYAVFDDASEMNEGLAQYAELRALQLIASDGPAPWRAAAARLLQRELDGVATLTMSTSNSFRLRYYSSGAAMALLLDRLAGAGWKESILERNLTLERALASAAGVDRVAEEAASRAVSDRGEEIRSRTEQHLVSLRRLRERQVDSILAQPGDLVVISAAGMGRSFSACGFDPQNLLRVNERSILHRRWWRPCIGGALTSELSVPSVLDEGARTVTFAAGDPAALQLSVGGVAREPAMSAATADGEVLPPMRAVKLHGPGFLVEASHARLTRAGRTLTLELLP